MEKLSPSKVAGLSFSPLGIGFWFALAGVEGFLVRGELQKHGLLTALEGMLLLNSFILSVIVALLLAVFAFRRSGIWLETAFTVAMVLVLVEIFAIWGSPQHQMAAGLSWGLRTALCVHIFFSIALYGHAVARSLVDKREVLP